MASRPSNWEPRYPQTIQFGNKIASKTSNLATKLTRDYKLGAKNAPNGSYLRAVTCSDLSLDM
eukprot:413571-Karenia_brevis.AAC.1